MSKARDEIFKFSDSYRGKDFVEKNKEVFERYQAELDIDDKKEIIKAFADKGRVALFGAFIEVTNTEIAVEESVVFMKSIFEINKGNNRFLFFQERLWRSDYFCGATIIRRKC